MSRNMNRKQVPESKDPAPTPQPMPTPVPPVADTNPFGISFAISTELVHLPSGGKFYSEDSPVHGLETIEIKSMTAKEEDIMINDSFIEKGIVFERLIDSIIVTPGIKSDHLIDCDKVAILVAARRSGYGDLIEIENVCGSCGTRSMAEISLTKMLERTATEKFEIKSTDEWTYDEASNLLSFELPVSKLRVSIKMMSREDNEYLKQARAQKERLNLPFNDTVEFIRRVLVSVNDVVDQQALMPLAEVLPAADARRIKYIHNVNVPAFNTKQEIECPNCSAVAEKEVPFSVGWFWSV